MILELLRAAGEFVPPFATERTPATSAVRETEVEVIFPEASK
jgi:hypothetical protein